MSNENKWTAHRVERDGETYITAALLWNQFIPSFNFEYDENELLSLALERGFVTKTDKYGVDGRKLYKVNGDY